jgi:hypothetical protein
MSKECMNQSINQLINIELIEQKNYDNVEKSVLLLDK